MTVKKAIEILNWWIGHKKETMKTLRKKWNYETYEEATGVAKLLFEMDEIAILNMEKIRKELVPNCTHPKKMRDLDPETKKPYCMACNLDL